VVISITDYVAMRWFRPVYNFCRSKWVIARRGQETVIVNSEKIHDCVGHYQIEVDGNRYKALRDGSPLFAFNNNMFANGGVGLKARGPDVTFTIDNFKVVRLR
jgi:hypothetical protein